MRLPVLEHERTFGFSTTKVTVTCDQNHSFMIKADDIKDKQRQPRSPVCSKSAQTPPAGNHFGVWKAESSFGWKMNLLNAIRPLNRNSSGCAALAPQK
jgi:hypothetical protein